METIPLVAHQSAATVDGRLEGLVFLDDGNVDDNSMWTAQDTANALDQCPYEEYLGLKLYMEDPLSKLRDYAPTTVAAADMSTTQKKFIDHEFPVYPQAAILIEGELLRPGIITPSNCTDFRNEGRSESKRMKRIPHFIHKAKDGWDWIRASSMSSSSGRSEGDTPNSKSDGSNSSRRRYDIFSSTNSVDPRNVIQGKVGNCGFCSIFASVVAVWPEYLQNAFGTQSARCLHDCGAYSIQLFPHGKRRFLLLDDYVLCHKSNDDDNAATDNGNMMLYTSPSMHSLNEHDLWIRLLEKAFVKLQGSIASLDGYYKLNSLYRHPGRALQLLTNASIALEIHYGRAEFNDDNTNNDGTTINNTTEQEEDEVYNTLQMTQGVCARVAHCRQTHSNLHSNHGYSLLWIGEVNVRRKIKSSSSVSSSSMEHIHHRLVCLRNPHGHGSYIGQDWGIDSSLWQQEEDVIQQLLIDNSCFMKCESTGRITWQQRISSGSDDVANMPTTTVDLMRNADDGIFFMSFSAFYNCFPIVTLVGPLSLSLCSDNSYHASSIIDDERLLVQQHDVPDCIHFVKGNLKCVREMIQNWL